MGERGPKRDESLVLKVWDGCEDLELQFSEIAEKTEGVVKKGTLINHLNALVEERVLEKRG